MKVRAFFLVTALGAAGSVAGQAQAITQHHVSVTTMARAPSTAGAAMENQVSKIDFGTSPLALGVTTGGQFGQREVIQGYDGRCVVIATGAPCQGGEAPLTTQTVLSPNKPLQASESTSASADASAYSRPGRVGAKSLSAVSTGLTHARIDPANPGQSLPGTLYSTGSGYASAYSSSEHINTLLGPAGTQATITLKGVASSFLFIDSTPTLGNRASISMQVMGRAAPVGQRCSNLFLGCGAEFSFSRLADPGSQGPIVLGHDRRSFSISFQAQANDVVSLLLAVGAYTTNSGQADASHTLTIDEIALSNGFSFADESVLVRSGNSYAFAAAVPEPESSGMLLAGLGLVLAAVRRAAEKRS
ncbi:MAG: PEP-CTERM sorting domain-containing protein [Pseudomonadota bacterium]